MANRYLYMGVKSAFTRNTGTVTDDTGATGFNSTYTDSANRISSGSGAQFICDFTTGAGVNDWAVAGETLWGRFDFSYTGGSFSANVCTLLNDSDQEVFRLRQVSNTVFRVEYNSGTLATPAWTQVGSDITNASSTRNTYVFKLVIEASGTGHAIEVYKDNVLAFSTTFNMALLTRVDAMKCHNSATTCLVSSVLFTVGIPLVGSQLACVKASGAGSNSGMTGAFTDVNEVALNDATNVASGTAGQRTTFAMADLATLPAGSVVGAECRHTFRANNDGTAPTNLKSVIRKSGVDTVAGAVTGLGLGYATFMEPYTLTFTEINTAGFELGWESAA